VYVDTNVLLRLLIGNPAKPFYRVMTEGLRWVDAHNVQLSISHAVLREVAHKYVQFAYQEAADMQGTTWDKLLKADRGPMKQAMVWFNDLRPWLAEQGMQVLCTPHTDQHMSMATGLMDRYALDDGDAWHMTAALSHGINTFLSFDFDISSVPGVNVLVHPHLGWGKSVARSSYALDWTETVNALGFGDPGQWPVRCCLELA
jgi:predicted nucleic acid-binding protein